MKRKSIIISFLILIFSCNLFAAEEKSIEDLRNEAIELMNNGKFEESIDLIEKALLQEPENIILQYEKALAHYKLKEYNQAIEILTPLKDRPDVFVQIYQILGNSYDFIAKKYTAIDIYNEGLQKFPDSGRLYMELGIAELGNENRELAITYFERGISAEPDYPNNYYHLAKILEEDNFNFYALMYAETFMNYVRNEDKFREINKLIFELYNKIFKVNEAGKISINNKKRYANNKFADNYINTLISAYNNVSPNDNENLTINDINKIRNDFIKMWFEKYQDKFESKILLRQKELSNAGLFEAYNYWLISDGDLEEFTIWIENNLDEYDNLLLWLRQNELIITSIIDIFPKL